MMSNMTDFEWNFDSPTVSWMHNGKSIVKQYRFPIRSAVPLRDATGVAVVEPFEEKGRDNAVVFNADGTERFRLRFPLPEPHGHCFDQMYYVRNTLTAIANLRGTDFAYELNEQTGEVLKSYETR
jgi:hypothetical protein